MPKLTHEEAVNALLHIRNECGAVCPEFPECTHAWCDSSCGAWLIADEALFGARKTELGEDPFSEVSEEKPPVLCSMCGSTTRQRCGRLGCV